MVNFVAFKTQHDLENSKFNGPWVCPGEKSEFLNIFKDWEPEVQDLLEVCQKPNERLKKKKEKNLTYQFSVLTDHCDGRST